MNQEYKKNTRLITLEGSEGAGKTTALKVIRQILDNWGIDYICTREPGGEPTAEKIREILLHSEHLHAKTELLLMFASRNEHIENVIKPALKAGKWVVSDRFVDASYAYQGGGRELGFDSVKWLDDFIVSEIQADFTVLLDLDPAIGLERIKSRGQADRIEQESMDFFYRIAEAYRKKAQLDAHRCVIIDASQTIAKVTSDIENVFGQFKEKLL